MNDHNLNGNKPLDFLALFFNSTERDGANRDFFLWFNNCLSFMVCILLL